MTVTERIAMLEALLERVVSRGHRGDHEAATAIREEIREAKAASKTTRFAPVALGAPFSSRTPGHSPPPPPPPPSTAPMVEPPVEAHDLVPAVPPDAAAQSSLESRSRLISAPPAPADDDEFEELDDDDLVQDDDGVSSVRNVEPSSPTLEVSLADMDSSDRLLDEASAEELAAEEDITADEIEEPAPSSSRRSIVTGELELDDDEPAPDSSPRHTPPPESGRQIAAPAVVERVEREFMPETTGVRRSSAPVPVAPTFLELSAPGSLEERHGTSPPGSWPVDNYPTSAPPASWSGDAHSTTRRTTPPPASGTSRSVAPPAVFSPEVTRAAVETTDTVAVFVHALPPFKPSTFGELLDATLGL